LRPSATHHSLPRPIPVIASAAKQSIFRETKTKYFFFKKKQQKTFVNKAWRASTRRAKFQAACFSASGLTFAVPSLFNNASATDASILSSKKLSRAPSARPNQIGTPL
jgi:hypothetical protein